MTTSIQTVVAIVAWLIDTEDPPAIIADRMNTSKRTVQSVWDAMQLRDIKTPHRLMTTGCQTCVSFKNDVLDDTCGDCRANDPDLY